MDNRRCNKLSVGLIVLLTVAVSPFSRSQTIFITKDHLEWKSYFAAYHVRGSFVLHDLHSGWTWYYNRARCDMGFVPASTYKIIHSLIALETGVIPDEHYVQKWDSVKRPIPSWNHDQDMEEAIRNSTVWYYQEIARRVGRVRMQHFLDTVGYGNRDISGPIDSFWLDGNLRITPNEQIAFLQRLYLNQLPFSQRSMDIVKRIYPRDSGAAYVLCRKTGWGNEGQLNVGWLVGYLVKGDDAYFFATNIEAMEPDETFPAARMDITKNILRDLGLIEAGKR